MVAAVAPLASRQPLGVVAARAPFHVPSLDGLRAVSFFLVFLAHAGLDNVVPGGFGVTVFFFLSGYLITSLMRVEAERTNHVNLKKFYLRRALRILPPFYIVLFLATVLGRVGFLRGDEPPQIAPVAAQVLHVSNYWIATHGWHGIASGTGVYWSLAVEEHFYLLFPALFLLLSVLRLSGRQKALCFWAACAVVLAWRCILVFGLHAPVDRTYLCSDTRVDSILFGCALAVWNNPVLDYEERAKAGATFWQRAAFPLAIFVLVATFVVRGTAFRETVRYTMQGAALTPLFIAVIRWPDHPLFRFLNWRFMRFVGELSYSLYLVHHMALMTAEQHLRAGAVGRAILALCISFAIAWTMYQVVERPCARIRRRLSATAST
jgi:peptidoglycan/LPS O-acetylase OafA/YrhL